MPTYGYRCPSCSTQFDVWQKMSAEPGANCPTCGTAARRIFYPTGIVFKGTGFYVTDNRASGNGAAATSSKGTKADSASSGDGTAPKSDTKSDTKTTTNGT